MVASGAHEHGAPGGATVGARQRALDRAVPQELVAWQGGRETVPSEPTLRRTLQQVDEQRLKALLVASGWMPEQAQRADRRWRGVSVDGKALMALRNVVLALVRWAGWGNVAEALRHYDANLLETMHLLGPLPL
ncbi:MAG: hypothetical protein ACYC5M_01795 [Anaerolineae bacterium]